MTLGNTLSPGVRRVLWALMALTVLVNAASMLTPIINEGDSVLYAALAQHMLQSGDYLSLVLDGKDWLDKPHFPFWMGALFFKLFGISAGSYILPGFLFHLLGGYYTYRLARMLYGRDAALLALLVYLSTYHLMYSTSALKAEAFLTGSIMGACYYCLRLDATGKAKHLVLAALLSAIAVMTKHEIVLAIIGGLFVMETASVIIQVVYFKTTGKRFFRMAPIHHHFEKLGRPETTVVVRFWIIAIVLALIGLSTLKLR